jgi:hypothetical protein
MAAGPQLPAMMARQLLSRLAGGGAPGGAPPGGGGPPQPPGPGGAAGMQATPPSSAGQQISQQLAELQGADPGSMLKILQQVKSMLVALYPRSAFTIPGVARNTAQAMKYMDNAIKEAEQAAATQQTVKPPIANNTGITPQGPDQSASLPGLQQFSEGA